MKNTFWNKIGKIFKDLFAAICLIVIFPFVLIYLVMYGIVTLFRAPFELARYKKSIYYKTYKRKYFIGITRTEIFHICTKLLENNIVLKVLTKPYGYWCLVDDEHLFAIYDSAFKVRVNGHDYDNPIIEKGGYNSGDRKTMEEFVFNTKFNWEESENKSLTIFLMSSNVDPELKYILSNNDIQTYSNIDELVKLIIDKLEKN